MNLSPEFLGQFLRHPGQTGAVSASGRRLCRTLANEARLDGARVIVELGSGSGSVTHELCRRKDSDARLICVEINARFAERTRARCPGALVVNADAVRLRQILADLGHDGCDRVVSGLPWAGFSADMQRRLLRATVGSLRPGGRFVTFAYCHGLPLPGARRLRRRLSTVLGTVERTPVIWANCPPAIVISSSKRHEPLLGTPLAATVGPSAVLPTTSSDAVPA